MKTSNYVLFCTSLVLTIVFQYSCVKKDSNDEFVYNIIELTANNESSPGKAYVSLFWPNIDDHFGLGLEFYLMPSNKLFRLHIDRIPFKKAKYKVHLSVPNPNQGNDKFWTNEPFANLAAFYFDNDAISTNYILDSFKINYILLEQLTPSKVVGSFELNFIKMKKINPLPSDSLISDEINNPGPGLLNLVDSNFILNY